MVSKLAVSDVLFPHQTKAGSISSAANAKEISFFIYTSVKIYCDKHYNVFRNIIQAFYDRNMYQGTVDYELEIAYTSGNRDRAERYIERVKEKLALSGDTWCI